MRGEMMMKPGFAKKMPYYLMILPALLLSMSVVLVPGFMTIITSFTDWNGISSKMHFIGLGNYSRIFSDKVFVKALGNNFHWMSLFLTVPVLLALTVSWCLLHCGKKRNFYQAVFLLPYIIAPIANALLWMNMIYSPTTGVLGFLKKIGLNVSSPISSTGTAIFGVAGVDIWHYWGFLAVIYLAAFRQTPLEQIEAAIVDGANGRQLFAYIYFPCLLPTFKLMLILIVIQSFMTFDYVYLITAGGPAHATEMLSTLAYTYAFSMFQFGRAASVSIIMSAFGLVASIIYVRLNRREERA
jgi:raffinose/stachyose/melibiose transport system permease protein